MDRDSCLYSLYGELSKFLHGNTAGAVARFVTAMVAAGTARTWWIAEVIAEKSGVTFESGLQAVRRLLGRSQLDPWRLGRWLLEKVSAPGRLVAFAIDWTEWHPPKRVLVGAAMVGKRAIPIAVAAFPRDDMPRSQNARENTFLRMVKDLASRADRRLVILTDRGFRRVSWIALLQTIGLDFVSRLMTDVLAHRDGGSVPLSAVPLRPGEKIDLGLVRLREDQAVEVRVVGIWAAGQKEPWWLATSLDVAVGVVASFYDRRMGVEEQFRDTKGSRYGMAIFWGALKKAECIERIFLLSGVTLMIWTLIGIEEAERDRTARFPHKRKGPRRSYATIGRAKAATVAIRVSLDRTESRLPPAELRNLGLTLLAVSPVFAVPAELEVRK